MPPSAARPTAALAAYLTLSHALQPLAPLVLRRRLARGKEDPDRWLEKLGQDATPRPPGPLVWLHAVGLGEVMALRGLIARMGAARPDLQFLVTSTARSSGAVFARNLPPRTQHRYLPLDLPRAGAAFLQHWQPDLSVWSEQDFWPGLVWWTQERGIPVALVNARMDARSFTQRRRWRGVYAPVLGRLALVTAQDAATARRLVQLGARAPVAVSGPLKAATPPLVHDAARLLALRSATQGRPLWLVASSHPEDEALALSAQAQALVADPTRLLILAPRDPARGAEIATQARALGLSAAQLTQTRLPQADVQVLVADTFGEMGLWFRLCPVSLIGGTFGATEGHNPWEPLHLGSAVLHGPRVANFAADFAALDQAGGARPVTDAQEIARALGEDFTKQRQNATQVAEQAARGADDLSRALLTLLGDRA